MVGIVVVSHSPQLARAAVDLALQMVADEPPPIAIAAGAGDDVVGTDAVRVLEAVKSVASPDGVLVLMDLGSAVLSAELALDLLGDSGAPVRLCAAPFVEGLLAAVVLAAAGGSLEEVAAEASAALGPKLSHLGDPDTRRAGVPGPLGDAGVQRSVTVPNRVGLHARPAAQVAALAARHRAELQVTNTSSGHGPASARSPMQLIGLGARLGDTLVIRAEGPDATAAADELAALVRHGFGELHTAPPEEEPSVVAPHGAIGVSPGRVVAPAIRMPLPPPEPSPAPVVDLSGRKAAVASIAPASRAVAADLTARAASVTGPAREVLLANAALAGDPGLIVEASRRVEEEGRTPERAVWEAVETMLGQLAELGGVMAERAADLRDVRERLVAATLGLPMPGLPQSDQPYVLVATDLAPADTALLDPRRCVALVTEQGGPTSHTAIIARALGIPAVVAMPDAADIPTGRVLLVDGSTGTVVLDPGPEQIEEVTHSSRTRPAFDGTGRTADGHRVPLLANVAGPDSVADAVDARAEGVGLFRTEFCFLDRLEAPTLEEQVEAYGQALSAFPGRRVVIRTLDAGADKPLPFLTPTDEPNPALGIRGFRTSWRSPQVLEDQLLAIAAAAATHAADVWVMAPMIDTVDEAADFAGRARAAGLTKVGIMIETPAAALGAAEILDEVDFASLGTNDLAQYTMAADRVLGDVAALNDPWQPAVLRLTELAAQGAEAAGKPLGVCGEAAADPLLAAVLAGLGVTSLSMTPRAIAAVAATLGSTTLEQCREAARLAVRARSAGASREAVAGLLGSDGSGARA